MILLSENQGRVNDKFIFDSIMSAEPLWHDVVSKHIPPYTINDTTRWQPSFYRHFALDIVTETVFNYPYPCITEKTLRPIASKRLFIVVGAPGTLELLRSKGFNTFDDILDNSYDIVLEPVCRLQKIVESIKQFANMSLADIKHYYKSNTKIFDNNLSTLQNLRSIEHQNLLQKLKVTNDHH